jgi:hypothetical protein
VTSTLGSFEAGVDGAKPGIIAQAHPKVGQSYRQEYYKAKAEDMAQVVSLTEAASVPYGHFSNLLVTREWSPLEPGAIEHKYYARGVGWIMTTFEGSSDQEKLVKLRAGILASPLSCPLPSQTCPDKGGIGSSDHQGFEMLSLDAAARPPDRLS